MVWKQGPNEVARLETDPIDWMGLVHHSLVTLDSDKQIKWAEILGTQMDQNPKPSFLVECDSH